jgi:hypothetical protein
MIDRHAAREDVMGVIEPPRSAVFLDTAGTLVDNAQYGADSSSILLLPGVLLGAVALSVAGYRLFVVAN